MTMTRTQRCRRAVPHAGPTPRRPKRYRLQAATRAAAPAAPGHIGRNVSLYEFDPTALPTAQSWFDEVLDHVDDGARTLMAAKVVELHVIPKDLNLADLDRWLQSRASTFPTTRTIAPTTSYEASPSVKQTSSTSSSAGEKLVSLARSMHPSPGLRSRRGTARRDVAAVSRAGQHEIQRRTAKWALEHGNLGHLTKEWWARRDLNSDSRGGHRCQPMLESAADLRILRPACRTVLTASTGLQPVR